MQSALLGQADQNTVLAGPASGLVPGQAAFRALVAADLAAGDVVAALTSGVKIAAGTSAITGVTGGAINTGLATVTSIVVSLAGPSSSGAAGVTASAIASAGWFSASVFGWSSSAGLMVAPNTLSSVAAIVNWIAVGT